MSKYPFWWTGRIKCNHWKYDYYFYEEANWEMADAIKAIELGYVEFRNHK
jgi:hypothetical protein